MVSGRLDQQEQELVRDICSELDGVPYVEKARLIRASLDSARSREPHRRGEPRRHGRGFGPADRRPVRIA